MNGLGRTTLQTFSLVLIFTSGLSLGVDVHLWLVSHDDHAHHDTSNCPICQQALSNPKLKLPPLCMEASQRCPTCRLIPIPETLVFSVHRVESTAPRGPPRPLSNLSLI